MLGSKSEKRTVFVKAAAILLILTLCLMSAGFSGFAFAVTVNGEVLAYAADRAELIEAVEKAQAAASEALGHECAVDTKLTLAYTPEIPRLGDADELEAAILDNIDGLSRACGVFCDGDKLCCVDSENTARSALDSLLSDIASGENTTACCIENDISFISCWAASSEIADFDELRSLLTANIEIETVSVVTSYEPLLCGAVYIYDSDMPVGETELAKEGVDGLLKTVTQTTALNGAVIDWSVICSDVVSEAADAVYRRGTRARFSTGSYMWPCEGCVTSDFGYRWGAEHEGIDIADAYRTPVYAADGGTVIFSELYYGYGNLVKIEHDDGDITWYAHMSGILVSEGDCVCQGELIGLMGSTGYATGVHLHFEYHPGGGDPVDPMTVLAER